MNVMVNKPLLLGDEFMPEMHLKRLGFNLSACETFTKNKDRIKKLKKQEIQDISRIYNELDKTCFQHDMAYGGFRNLNKRTAAD